MGMIIILLLALAIILFMWKIRPIIQMRMLEKKIEAAYKAYEEALKVFEEQRDEESLMNVKQAKAKYEELLAQQN